MDANDIFKEIVYVWINYFGALLGFDISQGDFMLNVRSFVTTLVASMAVACGIYTPFVTDLQSALKTTVGTCLGLQVCFVDYKWLPFCN